MQMLKLPYEICLCAFSIPVLQCYVAIPMIPPLSLTSEQVPFRFVVYNCLTSTDHIRMLVVPCNISRCQEHRIIQVGRDVRR